MPKNPSVAEVLDDSDQPEPDGWLCAVTGVVVRDGTWHDPRHRMIPLYRRPGDA